MRFLFLHKVYTAAFSSQRIGAQTVLKPISTTRFSFLFKGFKMRKIDSCVVWFSQCALKCRHVCNLTSQFKGIYTCAFGFQLFVAFYHKAQISSSCAKCFNANFKQQDSCAQFCCTSFSFLTIRANLKQNDRCKV